MTKATSRKGAARSAKRRPSPRRGNPPGQLTRIRIRLANLEQRLSLLESHLGYVTISSADGVVADEEE